MAESDPSQLDQLIPYLTADQPEARALALQFVSDCTEDVRLRPHLVKHALSQIWGLRNDQQAIVRNVMRSVINLTTDRPNCLAFLEMCYTNHIANDFTNSDKPPFQKNTYGLCSFLFNYFVERIVDDSNPFQASYVAILTNITRYPELLNLLFSTTGANSIPTPMSKQNSSFNSEVQILKLIQLFLNRQKDATEENPNPLAFIPSVLHNITQVPECRATILQRCSDPTQPPTVPKLVHTLLQSIRDPDLTVRRGILGTLRNCFIEVDEHPRILGPITAIPLQSHSHDFYEADFDLGDSAFPAIKAPGFDVFAYFLSCIVNSEGEYKPGELDNIPDFLRMRLNPRLFVKEDLAPIPLMSLNKEEREKAIQRAMPRNLSVANTRNIITRETEPDLRLMACQALLMLASSRFGRNHARKRGWVYGMLREGDKIEKNMDVKDVIDSIVGLLIRDEKREEGDTEKNIELSGSDAAASFETEHSSESKEPEPSRPIVKQEGPIKTVESDGMITNYAVVEPERVKKITKLFIPPPKQ
ncbi:putative protein of unknown function (DUF383) [Blattamonas nauphoetae]|uniref:Protein HGH1 homolog n=1 Tax=Blattamonas nauphoetae TaxID=2049346 RepID=A0ABQ9XXJ7_9EUKA|nr:putative protein of unknown function (DUF383) [Blattamonas nauphoetae]